MIPTKFDVNNLIEDARNEGSLVIMVCGVAGSGKTTFAQKLEKIGFSRLSNDEEKWSTNGRYGIDYPVGQYNHFRFEITDNDSILFYVTDNEKVLKTYRGTIKTTDPRNYRSARLIIEMEEPTHHILTSNPTTYRSAWDFYLVFKSPKFYNVFFEKGKWKSIE